MKALKQYKTHTTHNPKNRKIKQCSTIKYNKHLFENNSNKIKDHQNIFTIFPKYYNFINLTHFSKLRTLAQTNFMKLNQSQKKYHQQ